MLRPKIQHRQELADKEHMECPLFAFGYWNMDINWEKLEANGYQSHPFGNKSVIKKISEKQQDELELFCANFLDFANEIDELGINLEFNPSEFEMDNQYDWGTEIPFNQLKKKGFATENFHVEFVFGSESEAQEYKEKFNYRYNGIETGIMVFPAFGVLKEMLLKDWDSFIDGMKGNSIDIYGKSQIIIE